jgi:uncharacterized membrane protein
LSIIFSILLLGFLFYRLRVPALLGALAVVLLLPLFVVPLASLLGFSLSVLLSLAVLVLVIRELFRKESLTFKNSGFLELLLTIPIFSFLKKITLQWSEFYNIGEHIRDFAVLSAVIRDPISPKDPWLDSLDLYYYTYWYRSGYVLKNLFNLTTAETYHYLMCFSLTLLFVALVRVSKAVFEQNYVTSIFVATIVTFGSNLLGVLTASQNEFWWGPSRAVQAGITEFPAWSFVLGDLHPHYLSLIFFPFALLTVGEQNFPKIKDYNLRSIISLLFTIGLALLALLGIVYGANSWDVVGFAFIVPPVLLALFLNKSNQTESKFSLLGAAFCLTVLFLSIIFAPNLKGSPISLQLVKDFTTKVELPEFLSHWGWQFLLIFISLLLSLSRRSLIKGLAIGISAIIISRYFHTPTAILLTLLGMLIYQAFLDRKPTLPSALCGSALLVLLFTELFYFDDSYTGINERLNTIFKFYYFCWVPLSLGALTYFCQEVCKLSPEFKRKQMLFPIGGAMIAVLVSFFVNIAAGNGGRKIILPKFIEPRIEGLSSLENENAGSSYAIKRLRALPSNLRVLEFVEQAYSSSANICSLSEHNCYIGWRNHLQIQYRDPLTEYDRRADVLRTIYSKADCGNRRKLAKSESIGAVIFGPREKVQFPDLDKSDFSCFTEAYTFASINLFLP